MADVTCAAGPDAAGGELQRLLAAARSSLLVAVYELGPHWAGELALAARRGVRVRVLLDDHAENQWAVASLRETTVAVRVTLAVGGAIAHWKALVADARHTAVCSGNLIDRDLPRPSVDGTPLAGTREWMVIARDAPTLAATVMEAWRHAWAVAVDAGIPREESAVTRSAGWTPAPPVSAPVPSWAPMSLVVPARRLSVALTGADAATTLSDALDRCRVRAWITVPYVHPAVVTRAMLGRLRAAAASGADVRLLLGLPPEAGDAAALDAAAVPWRVMDPARSTTGHAKGAVVDTQVMVGSANWSRAGLGANLEAQLRLEHPACAEYFASIHAQDWETARPGNV